VVFCILQINSLQSTRSTSLSAAVFVFPIHHQNFHISIEAILDDSENHLIEAIRSRYDPAQLRDS
jgi:hypothetical protein